VEHARRIPNRISELRPLSLWALDVARELGCPEDRRHDVDLCLAEAVSNVIRHGYVDDATHEIRIEVAREPEALVLLVEDDARPFDPLALPVLQPRSLDEAKPAGRGVALFRSVADSASYERREGRNRLTLRFAIRS
jgi:serine/threonine-protein kinase RsbW